MNTSHWLRSGLALALSTVLLPLWTNTITLPADTCAGTGIAEDPGHIICDGGCETTGDLNCLQREDEDKDGTYYFCSCDVNIEPSCCHLVVRPCPGEDPDKKLDVRGLCTEVDPACASAPGLVCKLSDDQPVCVPVQPGGE